MNINKFIREECTKCNKCSHTFKDIKTCNTFIKNTMKIAVNGNKIIAISSYKGKAVKGVAKCAPGDTFDLEYGTQLAINRCNYKIAKKRYDDAIQQHLNAKIKLIIDKAAYEELESFKDECLYLFTEALNKVQQ